jgi:hypothetical protein
LLHTAILVGALNKRRVRQAIKIRKYQKETYSEGFSACKSTVAPSNKSRSVKKRSTDCEQSW